jgi:CheY-like chemotaxis protein
MTTEKPAEGVRILLVDDNPEIADLRASLLERFGGEVIIALTLKDAEAQLASPAQFDVIMLDVNLGSGPADMRGLALAPESHRLRPDTPIVAYSSVFTESQLPMHEHPEIDRVLAKGSLGLADLEDSTRGIVQLGREARANRDK